MPPEVVTDTDFAPAVPAGVFAVSEVRAEFTTTVVAVAVPTFTVVSPGTKPVPVTVIVVPPASGPLAGVTAVTVGTGAFRVPVAESAGYAPK